jgi:hypothetical protein
MLSSGLIAVGFSGCVWLRTGHQFIGLHRSMTATMFAFTTAIATPDTGKQSDCKQENAYSKQAKEFIPGFIPEYILFLCNCNMVSHCS